MDPYAIVNLVMQDLAKRGIKSRFGPEADIRLAAECVAQMLAALDVAVVEEV